MTAFTPNLYWLALPLVVVASIVYSASRHETWPRIWSRAARLSLLLVVMLIMATALLLFFNTQV